jgi:hypothetical protein
MYYDTGVDKRRKSGGQPYYVCSTNRLQQGCSTHYIRTAVLEELILHTIRTVSTYAIENEEDFIRQVREASELQQTATAKELRKKIAKAEKRQGELLSVVKKLLEANATGRIPDSHFDKMFADYANEQEQLEKDIAAWKGEVAAYEADSVKADRFLELAKRYTDFEELTTPMLNEFVEKVLVHQADKSSGTRVQQVDIYLSFIGNYSAPFEEVPPTPEEIEAARLEAERKAYRREITRRYRERQRAKKAAEAAAQKEKQKTA